MIRESKERLNNPDPGRERRSSPGIHEVGSISLSRHCYRESRLQDLDFKTGLVPAHPFPLVP